MTPSNYHPNCRLNRSFSRTLNRLKTTITKSWNESSFQQYSPSERATKLLTDAVDELMRDPPPYEQGYGLLTDIRYAVFNYVPWKHFDSRTTVTYFNFNPSIIQNEKWRNDILKEMINSRNYEYNGDIEHSVIIDREIPGLDDASFLSAWRQRWHEYLSPINSSGESANLFPSWNDFLLNYSELPNNMGVVWDPKEANKSDICGDYTFNTEYFNEDFINIYNSSLEDFMCNKKLITNSTTIRNVADLRGYCSPTNKVNKEQWSSDKAIDYSLKSLFWGFGIWGANSFISIPVTYSSSSIGRTGVLSIGSISPLSQNEISKWTLIANAIIGTLLNLESESRIINSTTNYAYRVGHPFKNRSNSIASFTRNLLADFDDVVNTKFKNSDRDIKSVLHNHIRSLEYIERSSRKLAGFGSLVNFLSALSVENNLWSSDRSKRWLTKSPVEISSFFEELADDSFHRQNRQIKLLPVFTTQIDNMYFCCNVNNDDPDLYLGKELLSAIFYELTINAIQYGKVINKEVRLEIGIHSKDNSNKNITLTNVIADDLPRDTFELREYDLHGAGGETLSGHLIAELIKGSPRLMAKQFIENGKHYHQYIINLPIRRVIL